MSYRINRYRCTCGQDWEDATSAEVRKPGATSTCPECDKPCKPISFRTEAADGEDD